ncbi:AcrR family transcriptional regulator [Desulfobaculum xiamenense]|uniref:AcrR family transcriptional regulator n=1 Tax=Desulfobaculum xiamenense TaxID=995050 RepID=A0A846QKF2_9BACT|nr:TetR/AcrR family transcriptional regulator [Desulfobaculum xiamenense]NJB69406.1 AcrR family transcriptional regulator [Desulfobaculum xiamenense]
MTAKKRAILKAATALFATQGYDATPVAQIAREAGTSEGAIFQHFKSKSNLLLSIFRGVRERFFTDMDTMLRFEPDESGLETTMRLVKAYCRFYETREVEFDFVHRNNPYTMPAVGDPCREEIQRIHDRMAEYLRIALTLGIRDGSIRPINVDQTTLIVLGTITGAVRMRLFEDIHLTEIEEQVLVFTHNALTAQEHTA